MFLRSKIRYKDGKEHRYYSVVENCRLRNGKVIQRHVLYLGEINDTQKEAWCKITEVFLDGKKKQFALFPEDRKPPENMDCPVIQLRLSELKLVKPRQWGACWLANELWHELTLDDFWSSRLLPSREGCDWLKLFKTHVYYNLLSGGSEWRLHRDWYQKTALSDILDANDVVSADQLYRLLDLLLVHKEAFFSFLKQKWQDMFGVRYDVLLYDLTSTYFECDVPESGKRKFGHSRDKRSDCVQVVIALIVTPDGFPLAYEVMDGNTSDKTTLSMFLKKIEDQYGKANRVWVMDRGIPTEEVLLQMKKSDPPISYLVGTPKGRLTKLEQRFLDIPWEKAREAVNVKLLKEDDEIYILVQSDGRRDKEKAMRQRKIKTLWLRLKELAKQDLTRDRLLMKIGAAKKEAGRLFSLVDIKLPKVGEQVTLETFSFRFNRDKLMAVMRKEGNYLLRSNLKSEEPTKLWKYYIQLTEIEQAFKELKHNLNLRPIFHQKDSRIEAHIFVAFVAYCIQVTLKQRLKPLAPGLTPRTVFEKMSAIQMVDVHIPTTDSKLIVLSRYTQPEKDCQLLLHQMKLSLPAQPPPKIYSSNANAI